VGTLHFSLKYVAHQWCYYRLFSPAGKLFSLKYNIYDLIPDTAFLPQQYFLSSDLLVHS